MKNKLLSTIVLLAAGALNAQVSLPNGNFESWTTTTFDEPVYYMTSNSQIFRDGYSTPNATKVADPYHASFAVNLLTVTNSVDTQFAYVANGDPTQGSGGIPYQQRPVSLRGYYKCSVPVGDTALILVMFKQGGSAISFDLKKITGTQNNYTLFDLPINLPPVIIPDTVIVAAASSNAFTFNGIPGSMLQIDSLSFTGVALQPTNLNGDFEQWTTHTLYQPLSWELGGDSITRTTDAYSGMYAAQLKVELFGDGSAGGGQMTSGHYGQMWPPTGGHPFTNQIDTLFGYYKFTPATSDSANVSIMFKNSGNIFYQAWKQLPPAASYTYFEIPFNTGSAPDSVIVNIQSSNGATLPSDAGNTLIIDEVQFKSQLLMTGITPDFRDADALHIWPNPTSGDVTVDVTGDCSQLRIYDATGRLVYSENNSASTFHRDISLATFGKGLYTVQVMHNGKMQNRRVVVQ